MTRSRRNDRRGPAPTTAELAWHWGTLQRQPGRCYGVRMAFLGLMRRPRATDESKIVSDRRAGCSADGGHHARLVTIAARGAEPRANTAARPRAASGTRPERAREMSTDSATVDRVVGLTAASRPRPEPQATRWCQHRAAISGRRYPSSAYRASRGGCPALPRTSGRRVL
jgi:hypothetical protein